MPSVASSLAGLSDRLANREWHLPAAPPTLSAQYALFTISLLLCAFFFLWTHFRLPEVVVADGQMIWFDCVHNRYGHAETNTAVHRAKFSQRDKADGPQWVQMFKSFLSNGRARMSDARPIGGALLLHFSVTDLTLPKAHYRPWISIAVIDRTERVMCHHHCFFSLFLLKLA